MIIYKYKTLKYEWRYYELRNYKDFFIEYAEKIYNFYMKRKEIKETLANIGLNADNLLNLNDCFKKKRSILVCELPTI